MDLTLLLETSKPPADVEKGNNIWTYRDIFKSFMTG
jgi:hypothetical protein